MRNVPLIAVAALTAVAALVACSNRNDASRVAGDRSDTGPALGLNDVSILLPLPAVGHFSDLPGIVVADAGGMIRADHFAAIPDLLELHEPGGGQVFEHLDHDGMKRELKVVALRYDPCFLDDPATGECQAQLRLVLQPVRPDPAMSNTEPTTRDAAVHLFYKLDRLELDESIARLADARGADAPALDTPLNVSPVLVRQGMRDAYAVTLRSEIARFATNDRLVRVAFMFLRNVGNSWNFGAFTVDGATKTTIAIPHTGGADRISVGLVGTFQAPRPLFGSIFPEPTNADNATSLVNSSPFPAANPGAELVKIVRIENPTLHGPGTVDCASCHIAMPARTITLAANPGTALAREFIYASAKWPLTVTATQDDEKALRAFGYQGGSPGISQRTVNESAAVLDALGKR